METLAEVVGVVANAIKAAGYKKGESWFPFVVWRTFGRSVGRHSQA